MHQKISEQDRDIPGNDERPSEAAKGFYARQFDAQEIHDLDSMTASGLDDEIAMLRVLLRRYNAEILNDQSAQISGEVVDRVSRVASRLARLVKSQQAQSSVRRKRSDEALSKALERIAKDLDLHL